MLTTAAGGGGVGRAGGGAGRADPGLLPGARPPSLAAQVPGPPHGHFSAFAAGYGHFIQG